jgi:RNA polymerase sigma-70 factor, ECF subfamily
MPNPILDRGVQCENDLIERARDGDAKAFEDLICKHHTTCVRVAISILRDRDEAQDEVQNAYCQAYNHLDQYREEPNADKSESDQGQRFRSWLLRIVKHQCLMLIRVKRRMPLMYIDAGDWHEGQRPVELRANGANAERGLLQREMIEVMQKEIRRMPPIWRNVLLLCDMEEMPLTDAAEHLNISVTAAKSRLVRGRRALRERVIVRLNPERRPASSPWRLDDKRASLQSQP